MPDPISYLKQDRSISSSASQIGFVPVFECSLILLISCLPNRPFQNPNNSLAIVFSGTFSSSVDLSAANITLDSRGILIRYSTL